MHTISSYRGNRPTNKHINRQDRLQYTVPLSLASSVKIYSLFIAKRQTDTQNRAIDIQFETMGFRYGRPLEKITAMMMYWNEETNRIVVTS